MVGRVEPLGATSFQYLGRVKGGHLCFLARFEGGLVAVLSTTAGISEVYDVGIGVGVGGGGNGGAKSSSTSPSSIISATDTLSAADVSFAETLGSGAGPLATSQTWYTDWTRT